MKREFVVTRFDIDVTFEWFLFWVGTNEQRITKLSIYFLRHRRTETESVSCLQFIEFN